MRWGVLIYAATKGYLYKTDNAIPMANIKGACRRNNRVRKGVNPIFPTSSKQVLPMHRRMIQYLFPTQPNYASQPHAGKAADQTAGPMPATITMNVEAR
jgi:hypothetical protein